MPKESQVSLDPFEEIFSRRVGLIKPGLDRMQRAYKRLGSPALKTPAILVAGTNGKGSTAGFLWQLLSASGLKVGLYTSPHLIHFRERIWAGPKASSDAELIQIFADLKLRLGAELYSELSFFEIATLLAFMFFEGQNTACNVVEVGMGGRWDATNVLSPMLTLITSLSVDHEAYLGHSLREIMAEKAGILREAVPLFSGSFHNLEAEPGTLALQYLEEQVKALTVDWQRLGRDFSADDLPKSLALCPPFLGENFSIARATYQHIYKKQKLGESLLPWDQALGQLSKAKLPCPPSLRGRFESFSFVDRGGYSRRLILDVCHNPAGAERLVEAWEHLALGGGRPALVSILSDKDIGAILDFLKTGFSPILLFQSPLERSFSPEDIPERHQDLGFYPSFASALNVLIDTIQPEEEPWAVCGSVAAIGKVLEHFALQVDDHAFGGGPLARTMADYGRSPAVIESQ